MTRLRPLFKSVGGKFYLAPKLLQLAPPRESYDLRGENFARGFSFFLALSTKCEHEHWNDLDWRLYRLYDEFVEKTYFDTALASLTYDEKTFFDARDLIEHPQQTLYFRRDFHHKLGPSFDFAVAMFVKLNMSRGGSGTSFAWSERTRGGKPGDVNAWETKLAQLPLLRERMKHVRLYNLCGIELTEAHASNSRMFQYLDPPYYPSTRSVRDAFGEYEMSPSQHERLLVACIATKGKLMLSGYANKLYNERLASWRRVDFDMPNNAGQQREKERRIECVWMNY